jgi:hypothetical protein
MTAETAQQAGRAVNWVQVYLDALRINAWAPGTVCVTEVHYVRDHRHPVPYRVGIVHNYRMENEHWHANEKVAYGCPDRQMKQYADD